MIWLWDGNWPGEDIKKLFVFDGDFYIFIGALALYLSKRNSYVGVYIYQTHIIALLRSENITGCKFFFNEKNHIPEEWQS